MRSHPLAVALMALALVSCAPQPRIANLPDREVVQPVGMVTRDYFDPERRNWDDTGARPLRTAVWYPAAEPAEMSEMVTAGLFIGGAVAPDAAVRSAPERYPLIVLSHGTGGSAVQMMWLGRHLASRGYIVAAANHHGNTSAEQRRRAQGFLLYWERARDLSRVIDRLLEDQKFASHIDSRRIGAAGFSLGGFTVLLAGGARFSAARYDAFCASAERDFTCEPQPEHPTAHAEFAKLRASDDAVMKSLGRSDESYRDPRIRAVFAIAPALGSGLTQESLRRMPVPVVLVVGDADVTTPPATNAALIASRIPKATLRSLPGVTHYTFLNSCTEVGVRVLELCRDRASVDRGEIHARVGEMADRFFRSALR